MLKENWYDDWITPALLRLARDTYHFAIQEALVAAGCDDMPRDGVYVIGGMASTGAPMSQLIRQMGVSEQTADQLVESLVSRGYLERSVAIEDRRRLTVTLTERGQSAAGAVKSAVQDVDTRVEKLVGAEYISHTLATLAALVEFDRGHLTPA